MKNQVLFFLRYYLFWIIIFDFYRLLFFFHQSIFLSQRFSISEILYTFLHSLQLDLAVTSYFFIPALVIYFIYQLNNQNWCVVLFKFFNGIIITLVTIISVSNIIIYKEWGTLLNVRALSFVLQPKEMIASLTNLQILLIFFTLIVLTIALIYFFNRVFLNAFVMERSSWWQKSCLVLVLFFFAGVLSRGGFQLIPINESQAYFSERQLLNHISTNSTFYLIHNLIQTGNQSNNPYAYFTDKELATIQTGLSAEKDSTTQIIDHVKPNVVIIIMESFTADIFRSLGGDSGVTGNLEKLIADGVLFTNIYSSGSRTDHGIVSVLSGFPATPNHSIIRYPDKTPRLPYLSSAFKNGGYQLSFYYGGELGFNNMNSYLLQAGFKKRTGKDFFKNNEMNSKWGAHDEFVLAKQLNDLNNEKEPFFSVLLTLSSHEPFEVPLTTPFNENNDPSRFRKAAYYTDHCLGKYFEEAKKTTWYKNTLFILVADHGHRLPKQRTYYDPMAHHIPLIFYGEVINKEWRGKKINCIGSQDDLASTLLSQFNYSTVPFNFSNNLLNLYRYNYAYLSYDDAVGWITDDGKLVYNTSRNKMENSTFATDTLAEQKNLRCGKSFIQSVYQQFLDY